MPVQPGYHMIDYKKIFYTVICSFPFGIAVLYKMRKEVSPMFSIDRLQKEIYVIAEMSGNHGGSLEKALEIVRAAAKAGADCLKVQTYTADTMTLNSDKESFIIKGGLWDGYKLYDLYSEGSLPWEWHERIKQECESLKMDFLSTPFDVSSADFLESLGVDFYKIASFELVDIPLIEYVAAKGKPMIISCGMGTVEEIQEALNACKRQNNNQIVLLKCTSEYPASYESMNLLTLEDMKQAFKTQVGLSDHSLGSIAALVGVSLGARVIEKHFCLSRKQETIDSGFSMEPDEFEDMVKQLHTANLIRGKMNYDLTASEKSSLAFRRSLYAVKPIEKGEHFTAQNIRSLRPAHGLAPKYQARLFEQTAKNSYQPGDPILADEVDE